ncbi:MAG TPA: phosphate acyltransferase PlsX [Candidatus Marinimicrobia bacterium]|nr:phosphate acyltransferase PlsX [Candidatus Neomarinimicrobiota bacterium]HRS50843.1 phosphate acyltransferase PlsX [Candidatus Neomarinimicrobiota bacterium]HRU91816.1 phosphate acyltransferase PlsX [Candidatus Neomarinimicrobiota bacterium]
MNNLDDKQPDTVIAVDAMGGDFAPEEVVLGAARVSVETPIKIILVGDQSKIEPILEQTEHHPQQIEIVHIDQYITNDDKPKSILSKKPRASMIIASQLCGSGKAQGMVSAGNTGAYILSSIKYIPRIEGIHKTAIASAIPTRNEQGRDDPFSLLLDVGANIYCTAEDLVQFAIMGKIYTSAVKGIKDPTVALLNIGKESYKGGDVLSSAYDMLKSIKSMKFIGNIEGNEISKGVADVIVAEGYVGNIVMKTIEGFGETLTHLGRYAFKHRFIWMLGLLALSSGIKQLKKATDYSEYGGAPLLGFQKIVIKAHGRSRAKAITNAIKVAAKTYHDNVCEKMALEIAQYEKLFQRKNLTNCEQLNLDQ